MPNKDPSFFQWLQQLIVMVYGAISNSPAMQGGFMAFIITLLRALYFDKEPKAIRIFVESLLCAGLAIGVYSFLKWANLPEELAVGFGAAIGFIGATLLHELIVKYLKNKAGEK